MTLSKKLTEKNEKLTKLGLPPVLPVAYFKRTQGRRCKLTIISYVRVMSDGSIYTINVTEMKTSTIRTFGSIGLHLEPATENDWNSAYKKLKKHLENATKLRPQH